MVDTTKLTVGQDVFLYGTSGGVWGKVVEFTPVGVLVQRDPFYGGDLLPFDRNGSSVDPDGLSLYLSTKEAPIHKKDYDPVISVSEEGAVARFTNRPPEENNS
jgi:hypothetical protein